LVALLAEEDSAAVQSPEVAQSPEAAQNPAVARSKWGVLPAADLAAGADSVVVAVVDG